MAPYFPFVQSSGMGKTKVLHTYKSSTNKMEDLTCKIFLSGSVREKDEEDPWEIFDDTLELEKLTYKCKTPDAVAEEVSRIVDKIVFTVNTDRLVLLFDEAVGKEIRGSCSILSMHSTLASAEKDEKEGKKALWPSLRAPL